MEFIRCPECGREVESTRGFCPFCGHELVKNTQRRSASTGTGKRKKARVRLRTWEAILYAVVLVLFGVVIGTGISANSFSAQSKAAASLQKSSAAVPVYDITTIPATPRPVPTAAPTKSPTKAPTQKPSYSSSGSSGSSSDTLKAGEYWCMGKNDTCKNKTYDPFDYYCSSCDRNNNNIEDRFE